MKSETVGWNAMVVAEQSTGCQGAGGYMAFAKEQGYGFIEVLDWTSSAGDWTFIVSKDGAKWFIMCQENNWPGAGFTRMIDLDKWFIGTAENVLELIYEMWR